MPQFLSKEITSRKFPTVPTPPASGVTSGVTMLEFHKDTVSTGYIDCFMTGSVVLTQYQKATDPIHTALLC